MRRYAVYLFGSEESDGARFDVGWSEDDALESRPPQRKAPIFVEAAASYREAKRRAEELNAEQGFRVSF